jgi:putative ATP-dependent endonuclease of OLD family
MSKIRIKSIKIENYRSFGMEQYFEFPSEDYQKPIAIVGYNNSGKTNLMNCILYALNINFVNKDTFSLDDFHNRNIVNIPKFTLTAESSTEKKYDGGKEAILDGDHKLEILVDGSNIEGSSIKSFRIQSNYSGQLEYKENYQAFGATRYFEIFYINFHEIKKEIQTKKTSWGNLQSFLAKHIKKIVDTDQLMKFKKETFEKEIKDGTDKMLKDSSLEKFITSIKDNYSRNLRDNNCEVSFGLPDYEDIFFQMMFKIGLNGDTKNLIPIDHFGDGYISMFVMAVIQAIAETNTDDKCLFLFEEPESFLHENHQEYFYKQVLCELSKKHQVIYTTHSDRMIDIFDTKGLIRLEVDADNQTVKKYNNVQNFSPSLADEETDEIVLPANYNDYIRTIEPNLNKILFSKKVILVEGPNDVMVYKFAIKKYIQEKIKDEETIKNKELYAETYLNFHNISIIPHHGKATAIYLIEVCKHFGLDYFVINDWDFMNEDLNFEEICNFTSLLDLKKSNIYINSQKKGMITTNWTLINQGNKEKIHFNIPKLEEVINYKKDDKNSEKIWKLLTGETFVLDEKLFPQNLKNFLKEDISHSQNIVSNIPKANLN